MTRLTGTASAIVATVEGELPDIVATREAVDAFYRLLRGQDAVGLDPLIEAALASPIASFAKGAVVERPNRRKRLQAEHP